MGTQGFYRGTSHDQVPFFVNKEQKMIEALRWPPEYEKPVDMSKVNAAVMCKWINHRITELLGFEDDIIIDYCKQQLFQESDNVCPKKLQINLTGFLSKNASRFVRELWSHLLTAQSSTNGIPPNLLDQKKHELELHREQAKQINDALAVTFQVAAAAKVTSTNVVRTSSLNRSTDSEPEVEKNETASHHSSMNLKKENKRHATSPSRSVSLASRSSRYRHRFRKDHNDSVKNEYRSRRQSDYSRLPYKSNYSTRRYDNEKTPRRPINRSSRFPRDLPHDSKYTKSGSYNSIARRSRSDSRKRHFSRDTSKPIKRYHAASPKGGLIHQSKKKLDDSILKKSKLNKPNASSVSPVQSCDQESEIKKNASPTDIAENNEHNAKPLPLENEKKILNTSSEDNKEATNSDPYAGRCYMDKVGEKSLLKSLSSLENCPNSKTYRTKK